jgi:G:T-mismatch repair DNA endonuclease (very short patch repair protein)
MTIARRRRCFDFRYCYLPEFDEPEQGIVISNDRDLQREARVQQSQIALKYLSWIEKTQGVEIRKASDFGGEMALRGIPVDGYIPATKVGEKHTVIQVHGCMWHGCLSSRHKRSLFARHPLYKSNTWLEVWQRTMDKDDRLCRRYNLQVPPTR